MVAIIASVDASWGRANAVADILIPVVTNGAEMGFAEATAVLGVFNIGSPVLGQRANGWEADALAVLNAPGKTSAAFLRLADALAKFGVVDVSFIAGVDWSEASATTFFGIEIIIIIYVDRFLSVTVGKNFAVAAAMLVVPVVAGGTLHGGAVAAA